MSYPKSLLPRKYYRTFNVNELNANKNYYLVRRSEFSKSETFDRFGLLTSEALLGVNSELSLPDIKQVFGMSLNFLGHFLQHHLIFIAKNNASKYWKNEKHLTWSFKKDIEISHSYVPIYFKLFELHNCEFPYVRKIDKAFTKNVPDALKKGLTSNQISACVEVLHKPTLSNFWHSEFHIKDKITGRFFKPADTSGIQIGETAPTNQKIGSQVANLAIQNLLIVKATKEAHKPIRIPLSQYNQIVHKVHLLIQKVIKALKSKQL